MVYNIKLYRGTLVSLGLQESVIRYVYSTLPHQAHSIIG